MGSNKGNRGRYGLQAFGITVLGPLLFYLINPIIEHFKGNRDAVAFTKTYVSQWDSIKLILPNDLWEVLKISSFILWLACLLIFLAVRQVSRL